MASRRRLHDFFSISSRRFSAGAFSLASIFRVGSRSGHLRKRPQQDQIFSEWCKRSKLSATTVRAVIQLRSKYPRDWEFSGSLIYRGILMEGEIIDVESADVLIEIAESGVFPSVPVQLGKLITKLCRSGFVGKAWDFFHVLKRGGCLVGTSCCNALLTGLYRKKDFEKMNRLFSEMKDWGMQPDKFTYAIVIDYLCKSNRVNDARKLFDKISTTTQDHTVLCSTIIDGMCRNGQVMTALEFFREQCSSDLHYSGCVVTYTILIDAFLKAENISNAMELYDEMRRRGYKPNTITYNVMVIGLSTAGAVEKTHSIISDMQNQGFLPKLMYYNMVISGFSKKNMPDKMLELLAEMETAGVKPDDFTYNKIISYSANRGDVSTANRHFNDMVSRGFKPNVVTYRALINCHCKSGEFDAAMKIFRNMSEFGIRPDNGIYSTLFSHLSDEKNVGYVLSLLDEMRAGGVSPNVITYTTVFKCLYRRDARDDAYRLMNVMEEEGCKPNSEIFVILIDWFSSDDEIYRLTRFIKA